MSPADDPGSSAPRRAAKNAVLEPFEAWDFEALRPPRSRSAEYNEKRLAARRRLEAIAKRAAKALAPVEKLDVRTSIHNPFPPVNGGRVERLWAYLTRPKAAKTKLRRQIGAELAKDLDHAYKNAYLCVALEAEALEVSFRIHQDAWYDGRNLTRRIEADGLRPFLEVLNGLDGYRLQLADWKGEWRCGSLAIEQLEEFFRFYEPGEHLLAVQKTWPAPEAVRPALLTAEVPASLVEELQGLVEVFSYAVWAEGNDHLFSS